MKESAERIQPESNESRKPKAGKSAEIIYINDFAEYSALPGGHLKREEYERVTKAAEDPDAKVNEVYATNAKTYAGQAEITLSPESLLLYSILRSENLSSELLHSDQQILAEVLRVEGRVADAEKLIAAYSPVITF